MFEIKVSLEAGTMASITYDPDGTAAGVQSYEHSEHDRFVKLEMGYVLLVS